MDLLYTYLPYIVLLGVILLFLLICYVLFKEPSKQESKDTDYKQEQEGVVHHKDYYKKTSNIYNAKEDLSKVEKSRKYDNNDDTESIVYIAKEEYIRSSEPVKYQVDTHRLNSDSTVTNISLQNPNPVPLAVAEKEITMVLPKPVYEPEDTADATKIIPIVPKEVQIHEENKGEKKSLEHTVVMEAIRDYEEKYKEEELSLNDDREYYITKAIEQYKASFGVLNPESMELVREITEEAFSAIDLDDAAMLGPVLQHMVVEEALLSMQKAYVAMPTEWMKEISINAFKDVVLEPKSSTRYLVAFDALKVLVHMQLGHLQVLAMTLLLQYSRNSNNYSVENLRHYVRKYMEPFLSHIPRDNDMYQQLDYLNCTSKEQESVTLANLFSNSYPLVFNYRGFSLDELDMVLDGEEPNIALTVDSLNSSMRKLAAVDETMGAQLLRHGGIQSQEMIDRVLRLATSKPVNFSGSESIQIFEYISPVLRDFSEIYNKNPMSSLSLTLLGLYLGAAHVKATIGEEFDLRGWL